MSKKKQKKVKIEATTDEKEKEVVEQTPEEVIADLKDKQLRLFAEFENFKKRTSKERLELYSTANEVVLLSLLPVIDDFERHINTLKDSSEKVEEDGVFLIFQKMKNILVQKGLKDMDVQIGSELNTDFHEAITNIPAPNEDLKGKIVDVIEKGYLLNEKVIRYAKVVIANNE